MYELWDYIGPLRFMSNLQLAEALRRWENGEVPVFTGDQPMIDRHSMLDNMLAGEQPLKGMVICESGTGQYWWSDCLPRTGCSGRDLFEANRIRFISLRIQQLTTLADMVGLGNMPMVGEWVSVAD